MLKLLLFQKAIICTLCFIVLVLAPYAYAQNSVTEKPYKATTLDECIDEKSCVLWAFGRSIRAPFYRSDKDAIVNKWLYPFNLFILGDDDKKYRAYIEGLFQRIFPYFPFDMGVTNDSVVAVLMLSDDFDHDLKITYRDFYKDMFQKHYSKAFKAPQFSNAVCMSVPLVDDAEIFLTAIFIKNDKDRLDGCVNSRVYYNLGFFSSEFIFPLIIIIA